MRFLTRRFIGDYDPQSERVYSTSTVLDQDQVAVEILDSAGHHLEVTWPGYFILGPLCHQMVNWLRGNFLAKFSVCGVFNSFRFSRLLATGTQIMGRRQILPPPIGCAGIYGRRLRAPSNQLPNKWCPAVWLSATKITVTFALKETNLQLQFSILTQMNHCKTLDCKATIFSNSPALSATLFHYGPFSRNLFLEISIELPVF